MSTTDEEIKNPSRRINTEGIHQRVGVGWVTTNTAYSFVAEHNIQLPQSCNLVERVDLEYKSMDYT